MEVDNIEKPEEQGQVYQIVLDSATDDGTVVEAAEAAGIEILPTPAGETDSGHNGPGEVTYIQVGNSLVETSSIETAITADGTTVSISGLGDESGQTIIGQITESGQMVHIGTDEQIVGDGQGTQIIEVVDSVEEPTSVLIEEDDGSADAGSITMLQYPDAREGYHSLLQHMTSLSEKSFDFPVFCSDGVVWSNHLLLSSMSALLKATLEDEKESACIIVPEISKMEFQIFQTAIFANRNSEEEMNGLDMVTLVKVAEIFGIEFGLRTTGGQAKNHFDCVNYLSMTETDKTKMFNALGYSREGDSIFVDHNSSVKHSSQAVVQKVTKLLGNDGIQCQKCQRSFVDEASLKRHHNLLHNPSKMSSYSQAAPYECEECQRTFGFAVNLKKHQWLCHTKAKKRAALDVKKKSQQGTLEELKANLLSTREGSGNISKELSRQEKYEDMKCNVCGIHTTTWKALQLHMMNHTNERPFKCKDCGMGFKERAKLNRHNITHSGVKPHKCSFCGKAFALRFNMKNHEKMHEGKGFECKYCGKMYSSQGNLKEHNKQHVKAGHKPSKDDDVRKSQEITQKKGRPTLTEEFAKKSKKEPKIEEPQDDNVPESTDPSNDEVPMEESTETIEKFIQDQESQSQKS